MQSINEFTQSQAHGLFWDSQIRERVFELDACKNDTKKFDIDSHQNKFDSSENISIKTSKNKGFGGGDILRFFQINEKCTIILIRYNQIGGSKIISEILEIDYNQKMKDYLFGDVTLEVITEYVNLVKSISPGRVDNDVKKIYKSRKLEIERDYNMVISINPKVDSKNQRRVQCSVNDIDAVLEKLPECLISRTESAEIRGVSISESIQSDPRKRNKK